MNTSPIHKREEDATAVAPRLAGAGVTADTTRRQALNDVIGAF